MSINNLILELILLASTICAFPSKAMQQIPTKDQPNAFYVPPHNWNRNFDLPHICERELPTLLSPENHPTNNEYVTIFAHGFGADRDHYRPYNLPFNESNMASFIPERVIYFDFDDSSTHPHNLFLDQSKTSLGQRNEIDVLAHTYHQTRQYTHNITLQGVSRGASTLFTGVGSGRLQGISAIIAESAFAHSRDVVEHKCKQFGVGWIPSLGRCINNYLLNLFLGEHRMNGEQPITSVRGIPQDLPILLICSRQDELVPASSTVKLYVELLRTGHTNVHLLIINEGHHANLMFQHHRQHCLETVHAFRRLYNLPHDAHLAQAGALHLSTTRYTLTQAQQLQKELENSNWKHYWIRNSATLSLATMLTVGLYFFCTEQRS